MRRSLILLLVTGLVGALASAPADARQRKPAAKADKGPAPQYVTLNGVKERVDWNDGDSFRILAGERKGQQARLVGYNTLESHGPVHFWGGFHGGELYQTHLDATAMAQGSVWECHTEGEPDTYGRLLVVCPELRDRLLAEGLAHVIAFRTDGPPEQLAIQHRAQNERKGMWAKGIPRAIVTSVHSAELRPGDDPATAQRHRFNGMADTRTGRSFGIRHETVFRTCDVFCHSGSCMIHIPFDARYGPKQAECARLANGPKYHMTARHHLNQPVTEILPDRRAKGAPAEDEPDEPAGPPED